MKKPWSEMTEEEWKKERQRIRKIQNEHFHLERERNGALNDG